MGNDVILMYVQFNGDVRANCEVDWVDRYKNLCTENKNELADRIKCHSRLPLATTKGCHFFFTKESDFPIGY